MKRKPLNPKLPAPYGAMTAEELEAESAKLDRELILDASRPLSPRLRAKLGKARRKRGRPRVGKGAQRVLVTIERGLLGEADALARKLRISRAQVIARGLRAVLAVLPRA